MHQIFLAKAIRILGVLLAFMLVTVLGLGACTSEESGEEKTGEYIHKGLATGDVGTNEYSSDMPGQSTRLPREYPGAPPLIPHSLEGLTIDKDTNSCLTCHVTGLSFGEGHTAVKIPESHYTDVATGVRSDEIQPLRYNCQLCHLEQSSEEPLISN